MVVGKPEGGGWRWLFKVKLGLQVLSVSCYKGRDALKSVGRKRAAEAHAPIYSNPSAGVRVPPHKALGPQVRLLDGAKAIRRFSVYAIAQCGRVRGVKSRLAYGSSLG